MHTTARLLAPPAARHSARSTARALAAATAPVSVTPAPPSRTHPRVRLQGTPSPHEPMDDA
jgi:hypothetical protein